MPTEPRTNNEIIEPVATIKGAPTATGGDPAPVQPVATGTDPVQPVATETDPVYPVSATDPVQPVATFVTSDGTEFVVTGEGATFTIAGVNAEEFVAYELAVVA